VRSTGDSDAGVRNAAVQAIGILGTDAQTADLVRLLQATQSAKERGDIEMALLAISSRTGARSAPPVLPLARNDDIALRIIALHVLASAGGPMPSPPSSLLSRTKTRRCRMKPYAPCQPGQQLPEDNSVAQPLLALAKSDAKTSTRCWHCGATCNTSSRTNNSRTTTSSVK